MSFEVDFSPIGNLAKTYNDARTKAVRERTLAELGQHFTDGDIDYRGLGAKLFALGEPRSGFAALQAADQRDAAAEMLRLWNARSGQPPQAANAPQAAPPPTRGPSPAIPPLAPYVPHPLAPGPAWPYGQDHDQYPVYDPRRP
jgi:hypothetical protein